MSATLVGQSVAQHNRPDIQFLPLTDVKLDTTILSVTKENEVNPLVDDFLSILRSIKITPTQ
jgi:LysR family transcriptional regulator, benzoate and cis,cis-muconate-responsive activator of ben and cat genes